MRKYFFYTLLLFAIIGIQLIGCKKNNPTPNPTPQPTTCDTCLPAITTNGAGTFGCRVNGKVWLPLGGHFNPGQWVEFSNQDLIVHGYNDNKVEWIDIEIGPITDTGYFNFRNKLLNTQWGSYTIYNSIHNIYFEADTIKTGGFHLLRFDPIKGFMSGTFEFDVYDKYHQHNNDTIHITDGRFDLHL